MEDLNKISSTRVGDNIHFYVNGQENKGTVVKMDTSYVTVIKDDGKFQDIHINDTFFIKDILVNKTWNDMNMEERTVKLHEIHAYSPRFLAKSWQELPRELKVVLENTAKDLNTRSSRNVPKEEKQTFQEQSTAERIGYKPFEKPDLATTPKGGKASDKIGETSTYGDGSPTDKILNPEWTPKDGFVNHPSGKSPKDMEVKKSNVEQGHYGSAGRASHVVETNTDFDAPDDYEGQTEDEKKEQFKHEAKKPQTTNKTSQEQLWEEWLDKGLGRNEGDTSPSKHRNEDKLINEFQEHVRGKFPGKQNRRGTLEREHGDQVRSTIEERKPSPQGGDIAKESMGGGDSSPAQTSITTGTTGMYNAVYGKDGRIKGQSKDKDEEKTEKDKESKEKERKG